MCAHAAEMLPCCLRVQVLRVLKRHREAPFLAIYLSQSLLYSNTNLDVDYHGNGKSFETFRSALLDT